MIEYAKRKEVFDQYEGKKSENTGAKPMPEKIDFDASGFVSLHYNKDNPKEQANAAKYRLSSNKRIDFIKAIATETGSSANIEDPIGEHAHPNEQEYEENNIVNELFQYKRMDMFRTDSYEIAKDIEDRLNRLVEERENSNEYRNSTLHDVEMVSREYSSVVNKAQEYLENSGDSEEEFQNKVLVKEALDRCINTFSGSMCDESSDESVLGDESIEIKIGKDSTDMLLSEKMLDVRKWPLFPWRPCIADIKQGRLGDCWLEAALASLVNKDPKYIEDSLRDNQDGTVTGRIYDKDEDNKSVKPRYYRVTKSIPHLSGTNSTINPAFSKNACLWPEMIRKILIKHIVDKGGKKVSDGTFVKNPSYRLLKGGNINIPETEIIQFFSPDYVETKTKLEFGYHILKSIFNAQPAKWFAGKKFFNSNPKEVIAKHFIKYFTGPNTNTSTVSRVLPEEYSVELEKLKNNIEPSYFRGGITSDEDLCKIIQNNSGLIERILSDENIVRLLSIKEIRTNLPIDIIKSLQQVLRKSSYYYIKNLFKNSGGLMIATGSSEVFDHFKKVMDKKYGDILGEIAQPNSVVGRRPNFYKGIYLNHSYTVLGVEEENGYCFVKIRNPWGFGQRYDVVTPDGKLAAKYDVDGDVGRIEILEFLKYFNDIEFRVL